MYIYMFVCACIVMCIPIARQREAKHISATQAHAAIEGHTLLGNRVANTIVPWGPCKVVIRSVRQDRREEA
jgi:hypothetical protein